MSSQFDSDFKAHQNEQKSLTFGYIRRHSTVYVPLEVMILLMSFVEYTLLRWEFTHDQNQVTDKLSPLLSLYNNTIQMQCRFSYSSIMCTYFYIDFAFIDDNVENVILYIEFYCNETDSMWKGSINSAYRQHLHLGQQSTAVKDMIKNGVNKFNFAVYFNIICIHYKMAHSYIKPLQMSKEIINYQWNIDSYMLSQCKIYDKELFSDNFDDECWCVACYNVYDGGLQFELKLLALPCALTAIFVQHRTILKCIDDSSISCNYVHTGGEIMRIGQATESISTAFYPKRLQVIIQIKILTVFDVMNKSVDTTQWKEHNIV